MCAITWRPKRGSRAEDMWETCIGRLERQTVKNAEENLVSLRQ